VAVAIRVALAAGLVVARGVGLAVELGAAVRVAVVAAAVGLALTSRGVDDGALFRVSATIQPVALSTAATQAPASHGRMDSPYPAA
jgi:hypothetical protein